MTYVISTSDPEISRLAVTNGQVVPSAGEYIVVSLFTEEHDFIKRVTLKVENVLHEVDGYSKKGDAIMILVQCSVTEV